MNIVITGANGHLANQLLEYYSNQAAFVVGTVRHLSKINKPKSNEMIIEMDPLDHYSINDAIAWIQNESGDIHAWLNIIGGFMCGHRVEQGHDDWIFMYNTNFMTTLNCCQQILPIMKTNNFGKIINMGAKTALNGRPLSGAYCASKLAVHSLTQNIALENTKHITCNAILPDIIDTTNNRKNMPDANFSSWTTSNQISKQIGTILTSSINGQLITI